EELAATAEEMNAQAQQLQTLVEQFKTQGDAAASGDQRNPQQERLQGQPGRLRQGAATCLQVATPEFVRF
ncbi:MAG: methyl-accepting chemotaxis protein, partial [Proteobacteria bacterium]|nr:methyl-accepting chemotaxis protein [Pseudomonadota bacterium]